MSLFTSILQNLKQKIDSENAYKLVVIDCIKQVVGVSITTDDIVSLKDGVLTIKIHPTLRSALLLKQATLIETLQQHNLKIQTIR